MYKVNYAKLAIMSDGGVGNISQGNDIAYMDCDIELIPPRLRSHLLGTGEEKKYFPFRISIKWIDGHIVI